MSTAAGTPRGRLAIALVIALATIAGLTVIGSTPAPAPALPPTDSTTDGTTDGTTGGTTGGGAPQHSLNLSVRGPGQVTGDVSCSNSSATPSGSTTSCPTVLVDEGASVTLTAVALGSHGQAFSSWSSPGPCNASSGTTCTFTMPAGDFALTAVFGDNGAPSVSVSSPGANELLVREPGGSVAVTSSSGDPDATRTGCVFDGALNVPGCVVPLGDTSSTAATPHSVAVTYADPSGNQGFLTRSFRVYILDTTLSGPTGTVTAPPEFSFGSTKQGSSFTCRIDAGTGFPCTSPYTADLPDGAHTFAVAASHTYETVTRTDSTPAARTFTIDRPDATGGTPGGPLGNSPLAETPTCKVPKLKGKTLRKAKGALTKAGCKLGKVTKKRSAKVARNRVVKSRPAAGAKVPRATKVALVLSRGRR